MEPAEILRLLERLLEWEQQMGGWEAPVWDDVRDLRLALRKQVRELAEIDAIEKGWADATA